VVFGFKGIACACAFGIVMATQCNLDTNAKKPRFHWENELRPAQLLLVWKILAQFLRASCEILPLPLEPKFAILN